MMTEEFRKHRPEGLGTVPFNLPEVSSFELENGLKCFVVTDSRFPTVNLRLGFRFGATYDLEGQTGAIEAMSSLMTEGSENYSSKEFAATVDKIGAGLSVGTGFDNTVLRASCLTPYFDEVMSLVGEVLLRPTFPEDELELYVKNAIEGLKYQKSQPDFLSSQQIGKLVYGDHPYGLNSPSEEHFKALTREMIVDAWKRGITPDRGTLVAVGDITAEALKTKLETGFAGWEAGEISAPIYPSIPERSARTLTVVDRPGSTQSNIVISNTAINKTSKDFFKVLVMNQVLGAGASSRLFMNLREEKGYTYGAYSRIHARRHAGAMEATSEVRSAVTGDSLKEFFYELERIRTELVSQEELDDAKNYLAGVFPIRAETQGGLTGLFAAQYLFDLPEDHLVTYRDKINAVTIEEVQEAAKKYIRPDEVAIVIVGDTAEIVDQIDGYAESIEILDADGNTLDPKSFVVDENASDVDLSGDWSVHVEAQGQRLPIEISLSSNDGEYSGQMSSMLGEGEVGSVEVNGNRFEMSVIASFQGQTLNVALKGSLVEGELHGTVVIPMMPDPLPFTGHKK